MSAHVIRLTWGDYDAAIEKILAHLRHEAFAPDFIVGIARGGLVPMTTLSHRLGVRHVGILVMDKTASDERFANDADKPVRTDGTVFRWDEPTPPRNILLVDDITAYGDTLRAARVLVRERFGPDPRLFTTSICLRGLDWSAPEAAAHDPSAMLDFHVLRNPGDSWIVFPWE